MYCTKRCLIRNQKGVSKPPKGHLLQAYWASFRSELSINSKWVCEKLGQNGVRLNFSLHEEWIVLHYLLSLLNGSSGFWSDKVCHLRLGFWGNVTRRKGEDGGLLKQSNGSHGGTVGAQSDGACLPILLAIYIQSVYPKIVIKNLYATSPSLFVPSAPPWYCVYLRPLRDSVCLLYKTFSLTLHISE